MDGPLVSPARQPPAVTGSRPGTDAGQDCVMLEPRALSWGQHGAWVRHYKGIGRARDDSSL
ncbi:hypothetical protein CDN98_00360 [Roseateles terrae]|nr:hypothetical protein CDN98_00360 [Roseateles terrae]